MMASHFKLLLSIVVASLFMITIRQANLQLSERSREQTAQAIVEERGRHVARMIRFDFNRIGLGLKRSDGAVISAGPHRIVFQSDVDLDGKVDTISYYLSDSVAASLTDNPHDKILYRVVRGEPETEAPLGVTEFNLDYFDEIGRKTTNPNDIRTIEISLTLQKTFAPDGDYSGYTWRTRISPPNLVMK